MELNLKSSWITKMFYEEVNYENNDLWMKSEKCE